MSDEMAEKVARAIDPEAFSYTNEVDGSLVAILRRDNAMKAAKRAIAAITGAEAKPRFRHIKRGTTYVLVGPARIQTDEPWADTSYVTVYRCEQTGALWARRTAEFTDGRFERIEDATPPPSRAEVVEECARVAEGPRIVKALRDIAERKADEINHHPGAKTRPQELVEWEAADLIERQEAAIRKLRGTP